MTLKAKIIGYWITTAILASSIASGGVAELVHAQGNVEGIVHVLGYPLYFLTIIGVWKVPGAGQGSSFERPIRSERS